MRTSSDVLDAINALERAFPVASWHAGDIDLWPSYRLRLYGSAVSGLLLAQPPPSPLGDWRRLADRAARALWRVPLAAWQDRRANAKLRSDTAAVFLSDGVSFMRLADAWFDRVVDPVIQAFEMRGLSTLKLTPLAEAHVPRHMPSCFVQPAIDRTKLLATRRRMPLDVPQFDALVDAARLAFGSQVPTREWLQVQAARLDAMARWFGHRLERSGAGHAFVNTCYSLEGQAFVLAARRLGLRSIDLQHGMQGSQHAAYARWAAAPSAGFSTLPDEYWVWGREEAAAIEAWSCATASHRARVTGNYWLQHWCDDSDPLVTGYLASARALRGAAATQVLVGLTWGVAEEETDKLIEAAKLCAPSIGWWWRLHPVDSERRAELAARLERHGLDGSRVGAATDLPLYALVRSADLIVSHSSTLIQEAAEFGVPSIVTSDYGAGLHAELIRQHVALLATDPKAIADAVETLAARPRASEPAPVTGAGSLKSALDGILGHAPAALPEQNVATP